MNIKFLDKVVDQIISETRVIDNKLYTPFLPYLVLLFPHSPHPFLISLFSPSYFSNHCKEVYSLNEQEIEYVWKEYKKEVTTLIDKKELVC